MPPAARELRELVEVEGACAASVNNFAAGMAALQTGEAFAIDEQHTIVARGPATAFLVPPEIDGHLVPKLANAKFIAASGVSCCRDFIGLWQSNGTWTVAAFSKQAAGSYGPVKVLLTSKKPLLGVTYFPAPDTQSGRIGLVQQVDTEAVRLIGYDWHHQSFFPVK